MRAATCAAVVVTCLLCPAAASAAITGKVTNRAGLPLPDVFVHVYEPDGTLATVTKTDVNGAYSMSPNPDFDPAPYTVRARTFDSCDATGTSSREATAGPFADGNASVDFVLDVKSFCSGFRTSDGPEPQAHVDPDASRIHTLPGSSAYLNLAELLPDGAQSIQLRLADGTPIGGTPSDTNIRLDAPAPDYDGPLLMVFSSGGAQFARTIGTLVSRRVAVTLLPGLIDRTAIVDLSGTNSSNDPDFLRRDAVNLLIDLARTGEHLGAVGFDHTSRPIFDAAAITGRAEQRRRLRDIARRRIGNFGGTDYNIGMDEGFNALTASVLDPNRQKAVIFVSDGGSAGPYENGHLRYAFNPSGRSWPICTVQLGTPKPADTARLKRIALDTGGQYLAVANASQLVDLYSTCAGLSAGERLVLRVLRAFGPEQRRSFARSLPRKLTSATFLVGWDAGASLSVRLRDPSGRVHSGDGGNVIVRRGSSYVLFRAGRPRAGRWALSVTRTNRKGARNVRARMLVMTER